MTEPRSGDAAPESQPFPLPPFTPPAPAPAPWPLNAAPPPFSAPQPPAYHATPDFPYAPEPPPLPMESIAPGAEPAAADDELMPWESAWMTSDAVGEVEALESAEPAWLSLDDAEEEPVALAEIAPVEAEPDADPGADEVPAWLSWMDEGESTPEPEPISDEIGLVEVGDLGAPLAESAAEPWGESADDEEGLAAESLPWVAEVEVEVEEAEAEYFAAEPVVWMEPIEPEPEPEPEPELWAEPVEAPVAGEAQATPFAALAERLERLAGELRSESPAALLAGAGRDPLEVLILGYALGQMHAAREGERG